jgi:hypothetical protein
MTLASVLVSACLVAQVFERIPTYGMTDPAGLTFLWGIPWVSGERHEILRNAGNPGPPAPTYSSPRGMPVAIDFESGVITRLDWTADGLEPRNGSLPASSWIEEATRDHRFLVIHSDATNLAAEGGATGTYLVDRDADRDGVFDEFDARRILALPSDVPIALGGSNGGHHEKMISDDGRYLVSIRSAPYVAGSAGGTVVALTDLDADGDGVLGSPSAATIGTTNLNQVPPGAILPLHSWRPSISGDGRVVAWEESQTEGVLGHDPVTGAPLWIYPEGWPETRRIFALNRDADADGLLDEPADHDLVDVTANSPLSWSWGPTSGVTESGRYILYLLRISDPTEGDFDQYELIAFELESGRKERWLPVDGGPPLVGNQVSGLFPPVEVHRGDRRVSFTTLVRRDSDKVAFVAARLDRDPNGDGNPVEGEGVVQTFEVRDVPHSRVVGSSSDGSILIAGIGVPPEAFSYDYATAGLLLPDCEGEVHLEYPISSQCPQLIPDPPTISIMGCPSANESVTVRVSTHTPTNGQLFLIASPNVDFANWNHACGAYMLGGGATVFVLLPAPAAPGPMVGTTAVAGTFSLSHPLQGNSFTLQGVRIEASVNQPTFGGRVVVKVR